MIVVYQYPACSTCRRAVAWLRGHGIQFQTVDIVANPPSIETLQKVATLANRPIPKLFNISGQSYRAGEFKTRIPAMSDAQMLSARANDGKLIKRPLLLGPKVALVGFDVAAYAAALT